MSDRDPQVGRDGIHIDRELADRLHIEDELDSNVEGPYRFPSPERRRSYGWILAVFALVAVVTVPQGWMAALGFLALAGWMWMSAWTLTVDENRALRVAAVHVPFPVGHASASIRFKGWRARPRWSVVLYSASEPPDSRGLVVVDAVTGEVVEEPYVELIAPV